MKTLKKRVKFPQKSILIFYFSLALFWVSIPLLGMQDSLKSNLAPSNNNKTNSDLNENRKTDLIDGFQDTIPEIGKEKFPQLHLNGYIKYLPSIRTSDLLEKPSFDQLLHNRLNFKANLSSKWTANASLRTRFFYGNILKQFPNFKDFLEEDFGYWDLTKVLWSGDNYILHSVIDRIYAEYKSEKWQVRFGRQRINWGINLVSNPNDLFNTYSFFDFDYEERPGTDAVRFEYFLGEMKRLEFAVAPGKTKEETVAAFLYSFNQKGYDIQFISGYFQDRWTGGLGWAGSIKETGFKGEISYFTDLNPMEGREKSNIVTAISFDHMLPNGTFLVLEYLYNQQREGVEQNPLLLNIPLQADNLSFTDHSIFLQGSYPINPILNVSLASFYYPSENTVFISPSLRGDLIKHIDVLLIGQFFIGASDSIFAQAGSQIAAAFKWNF
ncbi:hypothetical protein [Shivajiella indica]|uniref:Alginate export domain-containing protein n=1 Tax=Shivajiella indica TaxID=872115 RepID=A0ABW5B5R3_9BACT